MNLDMLPSTYKSSTVHKSPVYTAQTNSGSTRVKTNPGCV